MRCQKSIFEQVRNHRFQTKAQATVFIIAGIVLIALLALILLYNSKSTKNTQIGNQEQTLSGTVDQQYLNTLMHKCVKETVVEAQKRYGIDTRTSPPLMVVYIKAALPACLNNFKDFEKEGFSVKKGALNANVKITTDSLVTEVKYPIVMKKRGTTLTFDTTSYTFPRLVTEKLNFDKPTHIVSSDGTMIVDIPAGVRAYVAGKEIKDVGIKQVDRNFNGLSNSVLAGAMAYNGWPDDAVFTKPITMTFYYNERDVPPFIKEENLKMGYYNDEMDLWIGLKTEVDQDENKLTITTDHFSNYGTVVNCGGATDPITQIITPALVQEACGPCQDGWKFSATSPQLSKEIIEGDYTDVGLPLLPTKETNLCFSENDPAKDTTKVFQLAEEPYDKAKWDNCGITKCQVKKFELKIESLVAFQDNGIETDNSVVTGLDGNDPAVIFIRSNGILYKGDASHNDDAIKEKKYFVKESDIGNLCPEDKIIEIKNDALYKGDKLYLCKQNAEIMFYDDAEDLKGRNYYEVYFPGLGDTCLSGDVTPDTATGSIDPGFVLPSSDTTPDDSSDNLVQEDKQKKTVDYDLKNIPGSANIKTLSMLLTPICYANDDCKILFPDKPVEFRDFSDKSVTETAKDINNDGSINANDKAVVLKFYIEVYNQIKDGTTDACIIGSTRIEFKGTQPMGTYNLLCDKNTEGTYDIIHGKECSQCVKNENGAYVWKPAATSKIEACMNFNNNGCAPSLIGKKYFVYDPLLQQSSCKKCILPPVPTAVPGGWLVDADDCTCQNPYST